MAMKFKPGDIVIMLKDKNINNRQYEWVVVTKKEASAGGYDYISSGDSVYVRGLKPGSGNGSLFINKIMLLKPVKEKPSWL